MGVELSARRRTHGDSTLGASERLRGVSASRASRTQTDTDREIGGIEARGRQTASTGRQVRFINILLIHFDYFFQSGTYTVT